MTAPTSVETETHVPCCTAHGVPMTCARYRRTHFVEVRPCCSVDAAATKAESEARFEMQVMAGPIVDNASTRLYAIGELEYDGPRCAAEGCDTAVDNDNHPELCEECADQPHQFIHDGGYRDNWCICGRIRSIGGYSPVHNDDGGAA